MPWLDDPGTLVCRFEDLVGPEGGGSHERQLSEIHRVASCVERPLADDDAKRVADAMYSRTGLTFRKGQVGDWRNHFNDEHQQEFDRVARRHLAALGYDRDDG